MRLCPRNRYDRLPERWDPDFMAQLPELNLANPGVTYSDLMAWCAGCGDHLPAAR